MELYIYKRYFWMERLCYTSSVIEAVNLCQDICTKVEKNYVFGGEDTVEWKCNLEIILKLREFMINEAIILNHKKIISKTIYKLLHHNPKFSRIVSPVQGVFKETTLSINGAILSGFYLLYEKVNLNEVSRKNMELFETTRYYTRYFNIICENMMNLQKVKYYDNYFSDRYDRIWTVVLMNLESSYRGVREYMLLILKNMMSDTKFTQNILIPTVLKWSWMNRNKYFVFSFLLSKYTLRTLEFLMNNEESMLYEGLALSIKYKHLYAGSQFVVKVLSRQNDQLFYELIVKMLIKSSMDDVKVIICQWLTNLQPKQISKIYEMMNFDQLTSKKNTFPPHLNRNNYEKFVVYMNLFRRDFENHPNYKSLIEFMVKNLSNHNDMYIRAQIFEILVSESMSIDPIEHFAEVTGHLRSINEMILLNLDTICLHLRSVIILQTERLLNHMSTYSPKVWLKYPPETHDFPVITKTIKSLVFRKDFEKQSYQVVIMSLKLFQAMANVIFSYKDYKYLFTYRAEERINCLLESGFIDLKNNLLICQNTRNLWYLLNSEYDDVRNTVLKILHNLDKSYIYSVEDLNTLATIYSRPSGDETLKIVKKHFEEYFNLAKDRFKHQKLYLIEHVLFFNTSSMKDYINGMNQLLFGYDEARKYRSKFPKVDNFILLVNAMSDFVLKTLNLVREKGKTTTTFEIMDKSLQVLIQGDSTEETSIAMHNNKKQLLEELWLSLKACSLYTENFAIHILETYQMRHNTLSMLYTCLRINIRILMNCCHKGAIEAAGQSIGKIYKHASYLKEKLVLNTNRNRNAKEIVDMFENMFRKLLVLKLENNDFRSCRGYLLLIHNIIKNDVLCNNERRFLKIYFDVNKIPVRKYASSLTSITVLQLHQLNLLVKESTLNETILPYIDELMMIALENFKSSDWTYRNASLQLYASIVQKLVGQKQQCNDEWSEWEPVYVSVNEIIYKLAKSNSYILSEMKRDPKQVSTSFTIIVFEFMSRLEYRPYPVAGQEEIILEYRQIFWKYLKHENDKVRILAAKCFAQFHYFLDEIPRMMENMIICFFHVHDNDNFKHGLCQTIDSLLKKYVTNIRYMKQNGIGVKAKYFKSIRNMFQKYYRFDRCKVSSFHFRSCLLSLLMYVGFKRNDPIVSNLVLSKSARNDFGFNIFVMRTNMFFNDSKETLQYEVVIEADNDIDLRFDDVPS